ncbi:MAG: hypothetical protein ORN54_04020 [Cyclobacteriaceae bacterium]|nr:hypothetical protein [Cyclobacteriaceae bacterium]
MDYKNDRVPEAKANMLNIIVYNTIEYKNVIESNSNMPLSALDSLIHTLNMMDFMNALSGKRERIDDEIDWIVLNPIKL